MKAEDLFLKKYGNKITPAESWVIRFAEEYADLKNAWLREYDGKLLNDMRSEIKSLKAKIEYNKLCK